MYFYEYLLHNCVFCSFYKTVYNFLSLVIMRQSDMWQEEVILDKHVNTIFVTAQESSNVLVSALASGARGSGFDVRSEKFDTL